MTRTLLTSVLLLAGCATSVSCLEHGIHVRAERVAASLVYRRLPARVVDRPGLFVELAATANSACTTYSQCESRHFAVQVE